MRWAALILMIGAILVVLTPSNACPPSSSNSGQTDNDDDQSCSAVDCSVGAWSAWSSCTRSCGGGLTSRTRGKTSTASCGGGCPYHFKETKICNTQCCPFDCDYTWSAWSKCAGCGNSTQYRTPNVIIQSSCHGTACPTNETQSCITGV